MSSTLSSTVPYGYDCRMGDGKHFPRNPKSDELLARLAKELVNSEDPHS